jgi:wobble nucleotide-excising tRNase
LTDLKKKLEKAKEWLGEKIVINNLDLDKNIFYKDLEKEFVDLEIKFINEINILNKSFNNWIEKIDEKIKNPAKELSLIDCIDDIFLDVFNKIIEDINTLVKKHNYRVKNYDSELKSNQNKLEFHYSTLFNKTSRYYNLQKEICDNIKINIDNNKERDKLIISINLLKTKISNESL